MTATGATPWRVYVVAFIAAFATAALGGAVTDLGDWYRNLDQPPWKPPDLAFGPAWTTIFTLIALAGARAWTQASSSRLRRQILIAFGANAILNVTWSFLFFFRQRPDWALIEVGFLWLSIVLMLIVAGKASRLAGALLVPYLAWVSFAAVLNYAVVARNGPF